MDSCTNTQRYLKQPLVETVHATLSAAWSTTKSCMIDASFVHVRWLVDSQVQSVAGGL